MDSQILYRVQREDLPRLQKMLVECFARDPLYETLIPDAETRKRLISAYEMLASKREQRPAKKHGNIPL